MYFALRGSGQPIVVFESGIAATSQNWAGIQEAVSRFARTFTYDRAGLGWSSNAKTERTPTHIVKELRLLLQQARIPGPYLLVGHSFGGLVVRRFAASYPEEVAGVLLVDAMRTEDWPPVNEARRASLNRGIRMAKMAIPFAQVGLLRLAATSLLRRSGRTSRFFSRVAGAGGRHVLERIVREISKMPREVWPVVAAHWSNPYFYRGLAAHLEAVPKSVQEMANAEAIHDVPVCLLTPPTARPLTPEELFRIGPATRQVLVENCGHWVHLDEPRLVVEAIRTMVEEIRSRQ